MKKQSAEARLRRTGELFRDKARQRLARLGRPTTDRLIRGLDWYDPDDDPPDPWLMVGEDHPDGPKADPVVAILQSARFEGVYYVCRLRELGGDEAPPQAIALGKWWRVVEFD